MAGDRRASEAGVDTDSPASPGAREDADEPGTEGGCYGRDDRLVSLLVDAIRERRERIEDRDHRPEALAAARRALCDVPSDEYRLTNEIGPIIRQ